jgi:hypothetical protein
MLSGVGLGRAASLATRLGRLSPCHSREPDTCVRNLDEELVHYSGYALHSSDWKPCIPIILRVGLVIQVESHVLRDSLQHRRREGQVLQSHM